MESSSYPGSQQLRRHMRFFETRSTTEAVRHVSPPQGFLFSALALAGLVCAAFAAAQRPADNNLDVVEIRNYHLTMAKVNQFAAATTALAKLVDSNPELKQSMNSGKDDDATFTQKAAEWDLRFPQATAVLRSNGLATREYLVISLALFNDVMIVGMKKQGALKEYPPNSITPENAAFVEQNYDKLQQALSPLMSQDQNSNQQ